MRFNFLGCEIEVSVLFTSLICILLLFDKTGLMAVGLFSAAVHEAGHFTALAICRRRPDKIRFCAYGVIINKNVNSLSAGRSLAVFAGGCVFNLLAAGMFAALYFGANHLPSLYFCVSNLITAVFSALPVYGLDGYDILLLLLCKRITITRAEKIAKAVSVIFCVVPVLGCVLLIMFGRLSLNLVITSVYLIILLAVGLF